MSNKEYFIEVTASFTVKAEASAPIVAGLRRALKANKFDQTNFDIKVERVSKRGEAASIESINPEEAILLGIKKEGNREKGTASGQVQRAKTPKKKKRTLRSKGNVSGRGKSRKPSRQAKTR